MRKVARYTIKVLDSVTPLHGFVEALNKYFKETPWGDMFKFGTDGKCFYDETETYTYEFDLDYDTEVGEQIADVAKSYFGEKFDYIEPESLTRFCVVLSKNNSFADSEDQYEADKYKGKEWGVFAKRSRAWVAFGTEKAMKEKAKALNELNKKDTKVKDEGTLTLTEYLLQEAEVLEKGLQNIDEESYLQGFHHHIWHKAKANNWDKEIVNKMLDYFEGLENVTVPQALRKASKFIYRSEHTSNFVKNKVKDGAINYKHSKNDMPSYGVDLRNDDDEDDNDIYRHDMLEQTEALVEDANEKIQAKGYELVEDYYGDEVKLVVDPGYYEGFTLNIEADEGLPSELLEYAYGLMAEIAKEVGLVKMQSGGWAGPVYLEDSKDTKNFRVLYSETEDYDVAEEEYFITEKEALSFAKDLKKQGKEFVRAEKLERNEWGGIETSYPIKDSKKDLKDMTADEIIKLINEAGEKGRSWGWLEGKLPQEFFNMYGGGRRNRHEVFPVQQTRNYQSAVHLKKPKSLGGDLNFSWVPEYKELKRQLDELYNTYGGKDSYDFHKNIERIIKEEDSISKRTALEAERDKFNSIVKAIRQLIENSDFIEIDDYARYYFYERGFNFDQKDYMRALIKSRQNRDYKERQKRTVITTPGKVEITNKEDKVEPLSPEAEAYIRKVLREDTDTIRAKRQTRSSVRWNSPKDILEEWQNKREHLKRLLEKLGSLENKGTISGIKYSAPQKEVRYKKGGNYNSRGEYEYNGNYELTGEMTKSKAELGGVQQEHQKPLAEAIARAFDSRTVKDLKQALEDALEAVKFLPDDTAKIEKAKQDVVDFLEKQKQELKAKQETRTKRLPDKAPEGVKMIYLFPEDVRYNDPKEIRVLSRYGLTLKGKNYEGEFINYVVEGTRRNLMRYAKDYLDYKLHPDYLYKADEFAGDIEEM